MHRKAIGSSLNHCHVGNCFLPVSQKIVSRRYRCHFPVMVFSIMTSLHNKDQVVLKSWNESARWAQASTQYDMRTLDFCLPCGLVQQVGFSGSSSKEESPNCQYTFEDLLGSLMFLVWFVQTPDFKLQQTLWRASQSLLEAGVTDLVP